MDTPETGHTATAHPLRRPHPKVIGFIGKPEITDYEAAVLEYIGKCLGKLGHSLLIVPARGATAAIEKGVESQGAGVSKITAGVIPMADRTLVYPDKALTERLAAAYPDIGERENVVFINPSQLDEWLEAMKAILKDYGIPLP